MAKSSRVRPSIFAHFRDILILPFTVTVLVPYFICDPGNALVADRIVIQAGGFILLLSGLSLFVYTVYLFNTVGHGTLAPWHATPRLVVRGPYQYCRNPMITGVLFILIGEFLIFRSTNLLLWACLFFIVNTSYFILKEEPDLLKRFGTDYQRYKKHVPMWIPKLTPYVDEL
jgi:protein-S-isoprenylcysteine O-methyltransferase Ste14